MRLERVPRLAQAQTRLAEQSAGRVLPKRQLGERKDLVGAASHSRNLFLCTSP